MDAWIRCTHRYGFRPGEWAKLMRVQISERASRPLFVVEFSDGVTDLWPVYDDLAGYEFSREYPRDRLTATT